MPERLILLNKPYLVLCQFTSDAGRRSLADFVPIPDLYPAGRLDYDSEGLVALTNAGWLQHLITHPRHKLSKTYWVQVEGEPTEQALDELRQGVIVKGERTHPAQVRVIPEPEPIWPREPPIRERLHIPTAWLEVVIAEGRKRQVRHMTAAVGLPTLRLIRVSIGPWSLGDLQPGQWREVPAPRTQAEFDRLVH